MGKIKNTIISIILLSTGVVHAKENLSHYYRNVYMGEFKRPDYFGPLNPMSQYNPYKSDFDFLDDLYQKKFFEGNINPSVFEIQNFWNNEIKEQSACPNELLSEHIDYISYLYRLVSISYLFEATKLNYQTSSQLGITNSCNLKFDRLLGQCQAKTEEMKKFHKRAYGKFENEFKKISYDVFTIGQKKEFLEAFKKSNSLTSNPVFARVHQWCRENKKNCKSLNEKQFAEILNKFCLSDAVIMNRVCSEDDNFYGISSSNIVTELIEKSNAFGIINEQGAGQECLRRYKNLFKLKENQYADLVKMFPYIYAHLIETKGRYLQGDLFVPGSLREFDQKGLSDFLIALTPPKKEIKPVVIAKPKPEPKPIPVVKEEKVEVAVVEEPKKAEPEVVKLSEFESKVELLKQSKTLVTVDMDLFKKDYEFTEEMIALLGANLEKFQTRNAIQEMKAYDNLGSRQAPVGLIFLKYLIDTNNHQGLYNILNVLGDKFYVNNDWEDKITPHLIKLVNDEKTKFKWQILIMEK